MSSANTRFSSSSRSMRSIKDLSLSPAIPPTSAIIPVPQCRRAPRGGVDDTDRPRTVQAKGLSAGSVLLLGGECGLLLCARFLLVFLAPLVIGHAIDDLARFRIGERNMALLGLLAIPPR